MAAAIAALALAPAAALAQAAPATQIARATVVTPLSVVWVNDLSFGRIVARPTAGTVTVDPNSGLCSVTGAILSTGGCRAAQFAGMGARNMGARISISAKTDLTGPGQTMVMDSFLVGTSNTITLVGNLNGKGQGGGLLNGSGNQRYSINSTTGIYTLLLGARLNVNANQASGIYNGSVTISVQYQ